MTERSVEKETLSTKGKGLRKQKNIYQVNEQVFEFIILYITKQHFLNDLRMLQFIQRQLQKSTYKTAFTTKEKIKTAAQWPME